MNWWRYVNYRSFRVTPVPPEEVLVSGLVVGVVIGGDIGTEAMSLPSRRTLLGGIDLVVPPPGGDPIADSGLREEVASEVEALLGGWFHAGLESVTPPTGRLPP